MQGFSTEAGISGLGEGVGDGGSPSKFRLADVKRGDKGGPGSMVSTTTVVVTVVVVVLRRVTRGDDHRPGGEYVNVE